MATTPIETALNALRKCAREQRDGIWQHLSQLLERINQ